MEDDQIKQIKVLTVKHMAEVVTSMGKTALLLEAVGQSDLSHKFVEMNAFLAYSLTLIDAPMDAEITQKFEIGIPLASHEILLRCSIKCVSDLIDAMDNPDNIKKNEVSQKAIGIGKAKLREYIAFAQPWFQEYSKILEEWGHRE